MPQTLTSLLVHLVFSTKERIPIITPEVEPDLFAYIGGILKNHGSRLLDAGGKRDHIHLLGSQSKNIAVADCSKTLRRIVLPGLKMHGREFRSFHWQDGYGAFSFGVRDLPELKRYVATRKEHHRKRTFKEELIQILEENGVDYYERYLWN